MNANASTFTPDIFAHLYSKILRVTFSRLKPIEWDSAFPAIQLLYQADPTKFKIVSPLHQNNKDDPFHLSVELSDNFRSYRFHINGYFKTYFITTDIEFTLHYNGIMSAPKLLANFRLEELDSGSEKSA